MIHVQQASAAFLEPHERRRRTRKQETREVSQSRLVPNRRDDSVIW